MRVHTRQALRMLKYSLHYNQAETWMRFAGRAYAVLLDTEFRIMETKHEISFEQSFRFMQDNGLTRIQYYFHAILRTT